MNYKYKIDYRLQKKLFMCDLQAGTIIIIVVIYNIKIEFYVPDYVLEISFYMIRVDGYF